MQINKDLKFILAKLEGSYAGLPQTEKGFYKTELIECKEKFET